ncbi:glycine--tRNA ligase subunit beta [Roseofilum reptotaenium CS-1145]|uniref:Glycine--tRNA ligase beta subunit n=1 Tax=Roseofilum reptotaenium AO1-A TaxID=1925591 RepID=A0A1L9QU98_9CYAN|nr:glycine--tRNA ligase subunit beta [Roseofilum reptotaenium]MDB9517381.1 glycine--tRNA ligase subunit beta [Roseofilum reptotaenium CS-1145]OJJ26196.1 glycine--tRNA ligase subunit beta [Roseofilum reptotaenium AO1-A]
MSTFLLEVGTEELPADFIASAIGQWRSLIAQSLANDLLTPTSIEVYGTPRRLCVLIEGLPLQQPDREAEIKGPPAKAAFKDGKPTKAAEGFAKKQGVKVEDFEIRPTEKGDFVFIRKQIPGCVVPQLLTAWVPRWISGLEGRRFMRWGDGQIRFPRPIRWLVALFDREVLPIILENGSTPIFGDRLSYGHRVLHPQPVSLEQASDYLEAMESIFIQVDPQKREEIIKAQVEACAEKLGGYARISPNLLAEVTHLVEYPTAVTGQFDDEFLELPTEVTTMEMESHQRYFPVFKSAESGELLPYFITVSNGDPAKSDLIAQGNGRVIRARLADGQFFYQADLAKPLESYVEKLETVTFQEKLGSVRDKVERIRTCVKVLAEQLQLSSEERELCDRAALLCKADLVTQMVYEFPELQGVMGEKYALCSGEPEAIATGIVEHYLPKGAGDSLPQTLVGQVVGMGDRLDTLISIFSLGMIPSGSSDPFALRRAANAIISITWEAHLPLDLHQLLVDSVASCWPNSDLLNLVPTLEDFFLQRIRTQLQEDKGIDYDLVNAILGEDDPEYASRSLADLLDLLKRALFLQEIRTSGQLDEIYATVNRSARLAVKGSLDKEQLDPVGVVKPDLFEQASEQAFYDAMVKIVPQTQRCQETRNYQDLVNALAEIAPTVSRFFDGEDSVLVMAEDENIQTNRLNLLGILRNYARVLADFGAIVN